jgi:RimJ/RimL family protein N-acetyltransferase
MMVDDGPVVYPKGVTLSGGPAVTLRWLAPRDREEVWRFFERVPEEDRAFLKEDVMSREEVERWLDRLDPNRETVVVAEAAPRIVGTAILERQRYGWAQHVGEIRIVVDPDRRRQGLGYVLAEETFMLAVKLGLEKIVAAMMADQTSAVRVFERLGFRAEALLRDHVKDRHGRKHDLLLMAHSVDDFMSRSQAFGVTEELSG